MTHHMTFSIYAEHPLNQLNSIISTRLTILQELIKEVDINVPKVKPGCVQMTIFFIALHGFLLVAFFYNV